MFLNFFDVIPADGGLVNAVFLNSILATESGFVI